MPVSVAAYPGGRTDVAPQSERNGQSGPAHILPISARSPKALEDLARAFRGLLLEQPGLALHDLCYTASVRRSHHDHRLALLAGSSDELIGQLDRFLAGERGRGISTGRALSGERPKVAFVFSG